MSNDIWDGVILTVIGMVVVFAGLVILMVAIQILNRFFPDRGEKTEEPMMAEATLVEESEREKVAALAVALAVAMEQREKTSEKQIHISEEVQLVGAGRWAASGRERTMYSRQKAGRQWAKRSN